MNAKIDVITLGVTDLEQAREFYERGFGGVARTEHEALAVTLGPNSSALHLRHWDTLASDAGVEASSTGFRAFTLSYILDSAVEVDAVIERVEQHGGRVSKPPKNAFWGYSAYVTDPRGYLWKLASSKRHPLLGRTETPASNGQPIKPRQAPITIGGAALKRPNRFCGPRLGI